MSLSPNGEALCPETGYPKILGYLLYSHPLKYVTACYLLEMNVHDGHCTYSLLKVCRVLRPTNK